MDELFEPQQIGSRRSLTPSDRASIGLPSNVPSTPDLNRRYQRLINPLDEGTSLGSRTSLESNASFDRRLNASLEAKLNRLKGVQEPHSIPGGGQVISHSTPGTSSTDLSAVVRNINESPGLARRLAHARNKPVTPELEFSGTSTPSLHWSPGGTLGRGTLPPGTPQSQRLRAIADWHDFQGGPRMGYFNNTPLGRRTISEPRLRRSIDDATVIPQPLPPPDKKIQKFLNKLERDPNPMTGFGARYQNLTNYKQFLSKPTIGEKVKFLGKRALYQMAIGAPVAAGMGAISGGVSYAVREGLTDRQNRARAEAKQLEEATKKLDQAALPGYSQTAPATVHVPTATSSKPLFKYDYTTPTYRLPGR